MKACWLKMPVSAPGQLLELTVTVDGAFSPAVSLSPPGVCRMWCSDLGPTRIEGSPGQRLPGPMVKPTNELQRRLRFPQKEDPPNRRPEGSNRGPFWPASGAVR